LRELPGQKHAVQPNAVVPVIGNVEAQQRHLVRVPALDSWFGTDPGFSGSLRSLQRSRRLRRPPSVRPSPRPPRR
jgi:hypothetical protein